MFYGYNRLYCKGVVILKAIILERGEQRGENTSKLRSVSNLHKKNLFDIRMIV